MSPMDELLKQLQHSISEYNILEATGVLFGLLSVLFAKRENILVFPTGIISVLIYIYLTFEAKLYADMGINGYYFAMSIYGWYYWSNKKNKETKKPITTNSTREWIWTFLILILSFLILYQILLHLTDSDVPLIDAITTAIFFVGMQLMAKKKIENWIAWIIGDFISIPLYFYKGLILTSFQFLIFFIIAIAGYISWKKSIHQQNTSGRSRS
jgi:nicotinamide mononucleotide transporter